jgi:hypothetical protein
MTEARELVTKISFNVDESKLEKFEKSIDRFKLKFAFQAEAMRSFVSSTVNFFGGLASGVMKTSDLATSLGDSVENVEALKKAFQDFNIRPEQTERSLAIIQHDLIEARHDFGRLIQMSHELGKYGFRLKKDDGSWKNAQEVLFSVLEAYSLIEDRAKRSYFLSNYFGEDVGPRYSEAAEAGTDTIKESIERNRVLAKEIGTTVENLKEFDKAILKFTDSLTTFWTVFLGTIAPALSAVIDLATKSVIIATDANTYQMLGESLSEDPHDFDLDYMESFETKPTENLIKAVPALSFSPFSTGRSNSNNVSVNTNVQVNVPEGTPQDQARHIGDSVKSIVYEVFSENIRALISDNPQSE